VATFLSLVIFTRLIGFIWTHGGHISFRTSRIFACLFLSVWAPCMLYTLSLHDALPIWCSALSCGQVPYSAGIYVSLSQYIMALKSGRTHCCNTVTRKGQTTDSSCNIVYSQTTDGHVARVGHRKDIFDFVSNIGVSVAVLIYELSSFTQ